MQILMNSSQWKTMLSSCRKMFRTMNAHSVMIGMLNAHSQSSPSPPPPGA